MAAPRRRAAVRAMSLAAAAIVTACGGTPAGSPPTVTGSTAAGATITVDDAGQASTSAPTTAGAPNASPGESASDASSTGGTEPLPAPTPTVGPDGPTNYRVEVVARHPHDDTAWTQGLEFHQDRLLESTGQLGVSSLRLVEPTSGQVEELVAVDPALYAEGVTVVEGRAVQITWKDETLLTTPLPDLDNATVTRLDQAYDGEGWGLCYDGTELVMSDGSAQLQFRDPDSFELVRTVPVTLGGEPVELLNELECVAGTVWANVWLSTTIVAIDPATGKVTGVVQAPELVPEEKRQDADAVLNGIAFHPGTGRFWLTGKLWPVLYEVELVPL